MAEHFASMAGHFALNHLVGPLIMKLIDASHLYLKNQVRWQAGMKEELLSLQESIPHIQSVLSVCNQVEIKDVALNEWYWQLRDAIDEADDVLDEFEYWNHQKSILKKVYKFFERTFKTDPMLKKLESAVHKLHKISTQVNTFLRLLKSVNREQEQQQVELHRMREAGAIPRNELLGRSEEMESIRWWLRNIYKTEDDGTGLYKNISLLSLVGHGGMGKTTLLQNVFEDRVTEEFSVKMFVCAHKNFDVKKVIKNMLESCKKEKIHLDTLEALQSTLRFEVTSKRFLLVLDDIWEENDDEKWENLLAPLQYGSSGSKILISTRLDSVATKFANLIKKRKVILPIIELEEDVCLQLFNAHAFAGVENPDDEFRYIARKMVEKLSGCPLATKVIGGILNLYRDKSYWRKILNTNIGRVSHEQNHLMPILKLSYMHLPKFLQNCFSFCAIFPQNHWFDKDDLVRMWIALGIIESSNIQDETLEDIGRRNFNILVQKSFFDGYKYHDKVYYKLHDLLHELAQFVSSQESFRIVDERLFSNIPKTTRHLSINVTNNSSLEAAFIKMRNLQNLRSLFLIISDDEFDNTVLREILKASKSIRLLVIDYPKFQVTPRLYDISDTIDGLIHLRYLKVKIFWVEKFPRSISHLYHLQFVILESLRIYNNDLKDLMPNENCQLIIDYLDIKDPCETKLMLEPVRKFISFNSLVIAHNDELDSFSIEAEQWFLQQSSCISRLIFQDLNYLQSLPSSLKCFSSLSMLKVKNVPQLKLLTSLPASLLSLELISIKSLQFLPSSLPSLEKLELVDIPLLKSLPHLPSSLQNLNLEQLESLQCLPYSLSAISSLKILKLKNIPLLKSLPSPLPKTLNELHIIEVPRLLKLPNMPFPIALFIEDCHPKLMDMY